MPVIQLSLTRLGRYCKNKPSEKTIIETLPYLGLDIEDQSGDMVSVEYSPNRPDFSSEAGYCEVACWTARHNHRPSKVPSFRGANSRLQFQEKKF